jgi:hypothetical protein
MKVNIKDFNVTMDLGNKGIILDVYEPNGKRRGDLRIGKAKIEWCKGKTQTGVKRTWQELIDWFQG